MDAVDRISDLDAVDITAHILQCLPLKDAVRTSILSTNWRYKWVLIPHLILDRSFFRSIPILNQYYTRNWSASTLDVRMLLLSNIVNNILNSHGGHIHKFVLEIPVWCTENAYISSWLRSVSRKLVKQITLSTSFHARKLKLPSWIFSCVEFNHLTHLTISYLYLSSVSTSIRGFPRLISLTLRLYDNSTRYAYKLGILVSKCPLLENLDLEIDEAESCLTIHAPKLQKLVVNGPLSGIILEETVRIKMLSFNVPQDWDVMKYFGEAGQPLRNNLLNKFKELKHLVVNGVNHHSERGFRDIFSLLKMAPNLQTLEITAIGEIGSNITDVADCCLDHLKSTQFYAELIDADFLTSGLLYLVKLILSFSPLLEVMTINVYIEDSEKFKIVKELLKCHRASANAKIILCMDSLIGVDEVIRVV